MKRVKIKIPAKINLTLDVVGKKNGYHDLESLVCSVGVYDEITIKKRKDRSFTLKEKGLKSGVSFKKNNAFIAAEKFSKEFSTFGADITVNKKIPVGGGMGGSSADIAGVVVAMEKLYKTGCDVKKVAAKLGSDSSYMTEGGLAVISGKGDDIEKLPPLKTFYLLFITDKKMVTSKESFYFFDEAGVVYEKSTLKAKGALLAGDTDGFLKLLKNDLYEASLKVNANLKENIAALKTAGALAALMTGSGSSVYGIFKNKKERNSAYKKLRKVYGDKLIKAKTL